MRSSAAMRPSSPRRVRHEITGRLRSAATHVLTGLPEERLAGLTARAGAGPASRALRRAATRWYARAPNPIEGGLAHRLMAAAMDAARELGGRHLWLSVWERNSRAIAFYGKHGFRDVGAEDFWVGADCQTDRILVAPVSPGASGG